MRHSMILETMTEDSAVLEEAVSLASSLILKMGDTDGLIDLIYMTDSPQLLTTGRGYAQTNQQLEALATLSKSTRTFGDLANVVKCQSKRMSGCYLIFTEWDDTHQQLLFELKNAGIPTMVFLISQVSSALWHLPETVINLTPGSLAEELVV